MERIKTFVQKIQEIYYAKHPKSAIDIDLMMDYTRVMYMDLLEWRKEFTEPIHSDMAAMMKEHAQEEDTTATTSAQEPEGNPEDTQQSDEPKESNEVEEEPIVTNKPPITEPPAEEKEVKQEEPAAENTAQEEKSKDEEPELVHDFPEEESIAILSKEHTGISFEAPAAPEHAIEVGDTLMEEAPVGATIAVEIPAPTPAEIPLPQIKAYEPAKLFDSIVEMKDIRTSIGINDKYLFLNELFNNHKSDYEETLDKLNRMKTISEAKEWVKTKVAAASNWDNNDPTVQSFYALLEKHFSSR